METVSQGMHLLLYPDLELSMLLVLWWWVNALLPINVTLPNKPPHFQGVFSTPAAAFLQVSQVVW